jgi:hypothetical protein
MSILKAMPDPLEAFNQVRNDESLAHVYREDRPAPVSKNETRPSARREAKLGTNACERIAIEDAAILSIDERIA